MPAYYDIHTHSNKPRQNVVQVRNLFPNQLDLIEQNPDVWYSMGWHPWHINANNPDETFAILETAIQNKKIIALGETGLDRSADQTLGQQINVFIHHLSLARNAEMPVIVHAVRAYPDIIQIYKKAKARIPLIIHGFRGNHQSATQLLEHGFYLSFGPALFENNTPLTKIFKNVPQENLFLETDDSDADIRQLYRRAAVLRNLETEQLMETIAHNFDKCFGK
jgi:TatD DNase family protein